MKTKILSTLIFIAISAAMFSSITLAWFTFNPKPLVNEFTAGTVRVSAGESKSPEESVLKNMNPGDCAFQEYTITNEGSKGVYIRGVITGKWFESDGITQWIPEKSGVAIDFCEQNPGQNWIRDGEYWYYRDVVPGYYSQPGEQEREITLCLKICFDGNILTNDFQGKIFRLSASFEAVQASNDAINSVWPDNPVYNGQESEPELPDCPQWDPNTAYLGGTCVIYDDRQFISRHWTRGNTPGLMDSPWQEITDEWRDFNVYDGGETVIYDDRQFLARNWTHGHMPGLMESPWQEITDEWRDFNIYEEGDTVIHEGNSYKAKWNTQNDIPGTSSIWELIG